ncbi:MAG: hypothetical protein ACR2PT_15305, partial [Endozoicomonas sp.]
MEWAKDMTPVSEGHEIPSDAHFKDHVDNYISEHLQHNPSISTKTVDKYRSQLVLVNALLDNPELSSL